MQGPEPVLREQAGFLRSRYALALLERGERPDHRRRRRSPYPPEDQHSKRQRAEDRAEEREEDDGEAYQNVQSRRRAAVRLTNTAVAVAAELVERPAPLEAHAAAVVEDARRERLGRYIYLARVQAEVVLAGVLVPPDAAL